MYIVYSEFLLCNILHSFGNINWQTFLKGLFLLLYATNYVSLKDCFYCYTQQIMSAVPKELLISYDLAQRAYEKT